MIVDVHTHTPRFETSVPETLATYINTKWSPLVARPQVSTWAEYQVAMQPVDRAIVFNIAQRHAGNERVDEPLCRPHAAGE